MRAHNPEPCEIVPNCPICTVGAMTQAAHSEHIMICVCLACGTSLSVPESAMRAFRARQEAAGT